jgi:hypothetical protein
VLGVSCLLLSQRSDCRREWRKPRSKGKREVLQELQVVKRRAQGSGDGAHVIPEVQTGVRWTKGSVPVVVRRSRRKVVLALVSSPIYLSTTLSLSIDGFGLHVAGVGACAVSGDGQQSVDCAAENDNGEGLASKSTQDRMVVERRDSVHACKTVVSIQ